MHDMRKARLVIPSNTGLTTEARLPIPLRIGEVALVHRVKWTFWDQGLGDASGGNSFYGAALNHNFKLNDITPTLTSVTMATHGSAWAHWGWFKTIGSNTAFDRSPFTDSFEYHGLPVGGDQGVVVHQSLAISPLHFIVEVLYTVESVGEAAALAIAAQTSFSRVPRGVTT